MSLAARALPCLAALAVALPAAAQNPLARVAPPPSSLLNGVWNGVDLERRSNCTNAQNEGSRGTYAQFSVDLDANGNLAIQQSGITGLNCSYFGRYQLVDNRPGVQGTYSCTDGKRGDFRTRSLEVNATSLDIHMDIQLTATETCSIEAILGMTRFAP